jgi:FkbM family methyltransferase
VRFAALLPVALACVSACSKRSPHDTNSHSIVCPERGSFESPGVYFSQFYEDYVLDYVFRDLKTGTYVDVGANHPIVHNVTHHFYLKGWHGINIEPHPRSFAAIEKVRFGDVNVNVGISDTAGTLTYYDFGDWGGVSTFDREIALRHQKRGGTFIEIPVPVLTLNDVLETHPLGDITFMNIDVEGYERHVIAGVDLAKHHPGVVMVEATAPLSQADVSVTWAPLLKKAGYAFALFDGLNRYYVHRSRTDVLPRFAEIGYCVALDKMKKGIPLDEFQKAH